MSRSLYKNRCQTDQKHVQQLSKCLPKWHLGNPLDLLIWSQKASTILSKSIKKWVQGPSWRQSRKIINIWLIFDRLWEWFGLHFWSKYHLKSIAFLGMMSDTVFDGLLIEMWSLFGVFFDRFSEQFRNLRYSLFFTPLPYEINGSKGSKAPKIDQQSMNKLCLKQDTFFNMCFDDLGSILAPKIDPNNDRKTLQKNTRKMIPKRTSFINLAWHRNGKRDHPNPFGIFPISMAVIVKIKMPDASSRPWKSFENSLKILWKLVGTPPQNLPKSSQNGGRNPLKNLPKSSQNGGPNPPRMWFQALCPYYGIFGECWSDLGRPF